MEILKYIFGMSVTGSMLFLIFMLLRPLTGRVFSKSWHYKASVIILVFFILPIGVLFKNPFNVAANLVSSGIVEEVNKDNISEIDDDVKDTGRIQSTTEGHYMGKAVSCSVASANSEGKDNDPVIVYIKNDGLYFNCLSNGEEVKIQEGESFSHPVFSKSGDYITYNNNGSLYIYDIKNREYEKIADEVNSYDWIDGESIIYSTFESGFYRLNFKDKETVKQSDEHYYDNFKAADNNIVYGRRTSKLTEDGREINAADGIVEINLNEYDFEIQKFPSDIIIEGKMPTDDSMGYDPMIWDITDDGRYVFIKETFMSASISNDFGGIGVYDTETEIHTDFTDIYKADENMSERDLIVVPRNNNLAINPCNNNIISIIKGGGRDIIMNKEAVLLEINEDKIYNAVSITGENLVASTPGFSADGKKLMYSATASVDPNEYKDNIGNTDYRIILEDWEKQPHNIYEYDLETAETKKLTQGDSFDIMPVGVSKDTVLFLRHKEDDYSNFSLMKVTDGKEEFITDNIVYDDYIGYMENSIDIFH
jgi:hypothetical protein